MTCSPPRKPSVGHLTSRYEYNRDLLFYYKLQSRTNGLKSGHSFAIPLCLYYMYSSSSSSKNLHRRRALFSPLALSTIVGLHVRCTSTRSLVSTRVERERERVQWTVVGKLQPPIPDWRTLIFPYAQRKPRPRAPAAPPGHNLLQ